MKLYAQTKKLKKATVKKLFVFLRCCEFFLWIFGLLHPILSRGTAEPALRRALDERTLLQFLFAKHLCQTVWQDR